MKKVIAFLLAATITVALAACAGTQSPTITLKQSEYTSADFDMTGAIVMTAGQEIYGSDAPEVTYTILNNTAEEYTYGKQYVVEAWIGGKWYEVPFPANTAWDEIGIVLQANGTNNESFKFSALDYKMTSGKYRIIKEIGGKRYFAEFLVGQPPVTTEALGYKALDTLPKDYSAETAAVNGDLVITDSGIKNVEKLADFVTKVSKGEAAMVRILQYTDEGDPIISDFIYNQDNRGYFLFKQDNSRDRHGDAGFTENIYSYIITDGNALFLSNCADMGLIRTYPGAALIRIGFYEYLGDLSQLTSVVEKMTKDRIAAKAAPYKTFASDSVLSISLTGGLTYLYDSIASKETRQVKDPDGIATSISDVFWLDNTSFVLICETKSGLKYYDIVGSDVYQSNYGKSFAMIEGNFIIMK